MVTGFLLKTTTDLLSTNSFTSGTFLPSISLSSLLSQMPLTCCICTCNIFSFTWFGCKLPCSVGLNGLHFSLHCLMLTLFFQCIETQPTANEFLNFTTCVVQILHGAQPERRSFWINGFFSRRCSMFYCWSSLYWTRVNGEDLWWWRYWWSTFWICQKARRRLIQACSRVCWRIFSYCTQPGNGVKLEHRCRDHGVALLSCEMFIKHTPHGVWLAASWPPFVPDWILYDYKPNFRIF